jgi:uncharacterized protein with FMN-binding domain
LAAAAALAAAALAGCASDREVRAYYDSLAVVDPDLSAKADGRYAGNFSIDPPFGIWVANTSASVEVDIEAHRYKDIRVVAPPNLKSFAHLDTLRSLILAEQTLDVDAVSGATSFTGKAYLNAIAQALR